MNRSGTIINAKTLKCPVMLVVGDNAPAEEGVVECNSKLDPTNTTFLKMSDSGGLPQLTQPGKLSEAFKYFLQGMGYMPSASMTRLARSRTASLTSGSSIESSRIRGFTHTDSNEGQPYTCARPPPLRPTASSAPSHTHPLACRQFL
uniref:NDRG family member 4 n=1 Tax=Hucho hucho TaxID=62062 RepID=A0A4W5QE00_9TELE